MLKAGGAVFLKTSVIAAALLKINLSRFRYLFQKLFDKVSEEKRYFYLIATASKDSYTPNVVINATWLRSLCRKFSKMSRHRVTILESCRSVRVAAYRIAFLSLSKCSWFFWFALNSRNFSKFWSSCSTVLITILTLQM